jgi:hypothetical protein
MIMMGYVVLVMSVASEGDTESSLTRVQLDACRTCAVSAAKLVTRRNIRMCLYARQCDSMDLAGATNVAGVACERAQVEYAG